MMQSEYKLLKVKDKICHFARVTVEAEPAASGVDVSDLIIEPINQGRGEASRKHFADWVDAAVQGALFAGEALVYQGRVPGCHIVVVRVIGTDVDTAADDVACAAALASWQALAPGENLPEFDLVGGTWRFSFA